MAKTLVVSTIIGFQFLVITWFTISGLSTWQTNWELHMQEQSYILSDKNHGEGKVQKGVNAQNEIHSGKWVKFKDRSVELYAYSAHYDTRDTGDGRVVRIIVVSEMLVHKKLFCKISFGQNSTDLTRGYTMKVPVALTEIGVGMYVYHRKKWFREYILICHLSDDTKNIPRGVSLETDVTNFLSQTFTLEVEQQETNQSRQRFAVCVAASYNHRDPIQTVEWLEMQKLLGADKITIYNHTLDDQSSGVFLHYEKEGLVEFRQSTPFWDDNETGLALHWSPTINDCYYRNMYNYEKIVILDLDELIIPKKGQTYHELLHFIETTKQAVKYPLKNRSYSFSNVYYFFDLPEDRNQSKKFTIFRHRAHIAPSDPGYSVKSILDPFTCTNVHNHDCLRTSPKFDQPEYHIHVDPNVAANQHYKKCHFDAKQCTMLMETYKFDNNILKYKEGLQENMMRQLDALGLL